MMPALWRDMLRLFSSEDVERATSLISNRVTTGIVPGGYRLAQNWRELVAWPETLPWFEQTLCLDQYEALKKNPVRREVTEVED